MSAVCVLLYPLIASSAAIAQEALSEVIVTARKVRESLADVPLAVRVVSSEELRRAAIDGMQALSDEVPSLYFESMWGGSNAAPTLRGQAQPNQGGNNVGVFVDGVYQASNTGIDTTMLDLDRIEVVKGPQSSSYGRSTFSGAINYVSRRPSDVLQADLSLDGGTQNYRSISAALSGPVSTSGVALRIAASLRSFDGTGTNLANPGDNLGGYRKGAVSLAASFADSGWDVLASARFAEDRLEQPGASSLSATDYNCGSRNPDSGEWTYFCGNAPRTDHYDISRGIPDSTTRTLQAALHVRRESGAWAVESLSSFYRSSSDVYQDFDVSSAGGLYGVCTVDANCDPAPGTTATLSRTVNVNQVSLDRSFVEEFTQELRLHFRKGRLQITAGALTAANRSTLSTDLGATPATPLSSTERLTEILPGTPQQVGPLSILNGFLVADPNLAQINLFPLVTQHQHLNDLFGALDWAITSKLNAHAELRSGIFRSTSATTTRLSLDYHVSAESLLWLSAAEGENEGGSNNDPTLDPSEQNYGPESNWTYELGFRGPVYGGILNLDGALYYIDWRNSQILGPANSPGNHGFILRNVSGIDTAGAELSAHIALPAHFAAVLDYSYSGAHFKSGSEDVGSRKFCGLEDGSTTSNFCRIGPSRSVPDGQGPLVPYVDGNVLLRAPEQQWTAALDYEMPAAADGLHGFARLGVSHQGAVYFRSIDGASNGERTLLNLRIGVSRGAWSANFWASNLTNLTYIRAVSSRGPVFFPVSPRPQDLLYGDGRRLNLGLAWRY